MNIEKVIISLIAALFQGIAVTYICSKQVELEISKRKSITFFICSWVYFIIGFLFVPNYLRFLVFLIVVSLLLYFVFNLKDKKVVLYAFNVIALLSVSEILISLILVILGFDSKSLVNNLYYNLLANFLISGMSMLLLKTKVVTLAIKSELQLFSKRPKLINYLYIFLITFYLITIKNGLEFLLVSNYYINIVFIIVLVLIITIILTKVSKNDQLLQANKQMLSYVTKYEKIITEQGKANHEFKNQLMVIKGYAQMKSEKLLEYIDSVVQDSKKTSGNYLVGQLNKFPDGGVKGLLYYKLSIMDEEKIKYEINVETGVKSKLKKLDINVYKNITKILGVLLDNAIDASKKCKKKEIIILVSHESNKVIFEIHNTFKGNIELSKLGTGFTTKGPGHGYGLRLIKDIVLSQKNINITNQIKDEYYISTLEIDTKIKKK